MTARVEKHVKILQICIQYGAICRGICILVRLVQLKVVERLCVTRLNALNLVHYSMLKRGLSLQIQGLVGKKDKWSVNNLVGCCGICVHQGKRVVGVSSFYSVTIVEICLLLRNIVSCCHYSQNQKTCGQDGALGMVRSVYLRDTKEFETQHL